MIDTLLVSEQFYSLQGEGMSAGIPCNFLRLANCNLLCGGAGTQMDGKLHNGATWRCDTIEVWRKGTAKTFREILSAMNSNSQRLVLTGGEPLLQQEHFEAFWCWLDLYFNFLEVETNGTIDPSGFMKDHVCQWNVSPKLSNSGMSKKLRINFPVLQDLITLNSQFKFVVHTFTDLQEIKEDFGFIPKKQIWLMPAVDNALSLSHAAPHVAEEALRQGYNFSNRMHIQLWNKKTGV